jgi:hypothetical protein
MLNNTNQKEHTMNDAASIKIKIPIEVTKKADILILHEVMRNGSLIGTPLATANGGDYIG